MEFGENKQLLVSNNKVHSYYFSRRNTNKEREKLKTDRKYFFFRNNFS